MSAESPANAPCPRAECLDPRKPRIARDERVPAADRTPAFRYEVEPLAHPGPHGGPGRSPRSDVALEQIVILGARRAQVPGERFKCIGAVAKIPVERAVRNARRGGDRVGGNGRRFAALEQLLGRRKQPQARIGSRHSALGHGAFAGDSADIGPAVARFAGVRIALALHAVAILASADRLHHIVRHVVR